MIEFVCGCCIGGSIMFIALAIFMSSRNYSRTRMRSGTTVSFYNTKGQQITVELANDLRENDEYAVVRKPDTKLEFVLGADKIV